jgi:hypothetical protein
MVSVSSQNSVVQTRTNNIRTAVRLVLKPVLMRQNGVQNNAFQAVSATLMIMFVRTVAMVVFALNVINVENKVYEDELHFFLTVLSCV